MKKHMKTWGPKKYTCKDFQDINQRGLGVIAVVVTGDRHTCLNSGALDFDPDESQVEKRNHRMKTIVEASMVAGLCLCDALVVNGSRCCKSAFGFIGKAVKGNLASFLW